jgi:crotonobetainyl-CoA:carnitine CoA-transferase CaiB-like acyl-CoA transferase
MTGKTSPRPLDGIRVLEMGQLLAGPFAGCVLGYFGAEVIKIEPPRGDPIRGWRVVRDGTSLWWHSLARNKKSVTLDMQSARGRELARAPGQPAAMMPRR